MDTQHIGRVKPRSLRVGYFNANGLKAQREEVSAFLREHDIDILLVQETFLKPSHKDPKVANYNIVRNDRLRSTLGGTLVYYRRSLHCVPLDPPPLSSIEVSICRIGMTGHQSITLISAYNSPSQNADLPRQSFADDVSTLMSLGSAVLLAGDLNSKNTLWGCHVTNQRGKTLEHLAGTLHFDLITPTEPTHYPIITSHRADILDVALLKNINLRLCSVEVLQELDSDHRPVILSFAPRIGPSDTGQSTQTRMVTDWGRLGESLKSTSSVHLDRIPDSIRSMEDAIGAIDSLTDHVQSLVGECSRRVPVTDDRHWRLPQDIRDLMREKNAAIRAHDRFPSEPNRARMRALQRAVKARIDDLRQERWDATLSELDPSHLAFWKLSRSLLKDTVAPMPPLNRPNLPPAFDDVEKAECLADSLELQCTVSTLPVDPRHQRRVDNEVALLNTSTTHPPVEGEDNPLPHTTPDEVESIIRSLQPKKAPGSDSISNRVLKLFPATLITLLVAIFNAAMDNNIFPHQWKNAVVIGIPKPGKDKSEPTSYRPISLLNGMGKIYERIILKRLRTYAEANSLLPDEQFGFRTKHSCVQQVHRIVEHVSFRFQSNMLTGALFFDVAKAFDKVWHNGLIYKLINMGVPHRLVLIIRDYLSNRQFRYRVEGSLSTPHPIHAGVPQGSVLSPILFSLYTSDIPKHRQAQTALFADDTAIFYSGKTPEGVAAKLQSAANALGVWFRKWRIEVNPEKSQAVLFHRRKRNRPHTPAPITMFGKPIPWGERAKYLGVILDQRLTFIPHIRAVRSRAAMAMGRLHCLLNARSRLSLRSKVRIYTACIRPIMTYASVVFAHVHPRRLRSMQTLQNRFMRMATGAPWYLRNENLHIDLDLPTIRQLLKQHSQTYFDSAMSHPNPLVVAAANYKPSKISRTRRPRHVLDEPDDEITTAQLAAHQSRSPSFRPIPRHRRRGRLRRRVTDRPPVGTRLATPGV